jgi:hypothetical protein
MTNDLMEKKGTLEDELRSNINAIEVVQVLDAESFAAAGERVKTLTEIEKKVTGYWASLKEAAHKTWKGVVAKEKDMLDPLAKKKDEQKLLAKKWADAEEAKRREEERKAQEIAQKQADDEALARAADLEKNGEKEEAEAIISAPVPVAQVVVPSSVPKGYGGMTTKYYSAVVTDIKALAKAVLEGKVPAMAIQGNETFLNAQARQLKETMAYPGVKVNVR